MCRPWLALTLALALMPALALILAHALMLAHAFAPCHVSAACNLKQAVPAPTVTAYPVPPVGPLAGTDGYCSPGRGGVDGRD
jgi:hypothetical protein